MKILDRKSHWENIYKQKELYEVSWYQPVPQTSLDFIEDLNINTSSNIIDIGGGDSFLVDSLINKGYQNLTVLDISQAAIERAKIRLGEKASRVKWIVSDITQFQPKEEYDLWHDRAAFHFLTSEIETEKYLEVARRSIKINGKLIISTFSDQGPTKCSGIEIHQYSREQLVRRFTPDFEKLTCINLNHITPTGSNQNFTFCSFRKR